MVERTKKKTPSAAAEWLAQQDPIRDQFGRLKWGPKKPTPVFTIMEEDG